jgi:predicted class III extradiol MEMO1 family dioxygenase
MTSLRSPAVAGKFYPGRADELSRAVQNYISPPDNAVESRPIAAFGCIAPHAGYIYSGSVAGAVYSQLDIPASCVILCPNHTGMGHPLAIMASTTWQTPLGEVAPDRELAAQLLRRFPLMAEDSAAHRSEHAIEVQLPFLQVRRPAQQKSPHKSEHESQHHSKSGESKIVPIAIGTSDFDVLSEMGRALADVISERQRERHERVLMVASSDMNHYESDRITRVKDRMAIDRVLALDARGLWDVVMREDISMCGFCPTVVLLTAAKLLGANAAALIKYATSGEVSGNYDSVVGYAGIVVT